MSHQPERKETNCLNCGTTVVGRYCHACGQENVETQESFWSLVKHFVYDIFHFDSKFFDTVRDLLFHPGLVPKEYVAGRRAHYLHPIRMYLFSSALFFLVFFALEKLGSNVFTIDSPVGPLSRADRTRLIRELDGELAKQPTDSSLIRKMVLLRDTTKPVYVSDLSDENTFIGPGSAYRSIARYDSVQQVLQPAKRDNWIKKMVTRKTLELNARYHGNVLEGLKEYFELFFHKLPYLLFISLPFFALILKLLYVRRRNFFYSDHATFTLYHYIFSFILLMLVFVLSGLEKRFGLSFLTYINLALVLIWAWYLLRSMRRFYAQGWGKTFSKFLLLNLLGLVVLLLLFIIFLFFTLLQL